VRSYWEHVGEHIGNLMGNNKSPTPPTNPQQMHECLTSLPARKFYAEWKEIHFLDIEFIPYELSSRKKLLSLIVIRCQ